MNYLKKVARFSSLFYLLLCFPIFFGMTPESSQMSLTHCVDWSSSGLFCDFESECLWRWTEPTKDTAGFNVTSFKEVRRLGQSEPDHSFAGPSKPADNNDTNEHFLFFSLRPKVNYKNSMTQIWSPWFNETSGNCRMEADILLHKFRDIQMPIKILLETANTTAWVDLKNVHNKVEQTTTSNNWRTSTFAVGQISRRFRLIIEVLVNHMRPSFVAIDNLKLIDCVPDVYCTSADCTGVRCDSDKRCLQRNRLCDLSRDCPGGEDEEYCDGFPEGGRCDFEGNHTCGWKNVEYDQADWRIEQSPSHKELTAGGMDHTFGNTSGYYMLSEWTDDSTYLDQGTLISPIFRPPPCYHRNNASIYYNSCQLRLYLQTIGKSPGRAIIIDLVDARVPDKAAYKLLQLPPGSGKNNRWLRFVEPIPQGVTFSFQIRVIHTRGIRSFANLGFDDVSLSPECFGIGVPTDAFLKCPPPPPTTIGPDHPDFPTTSYKPPTGASVFVLSTCGATGHKGPTEKQCQTFYQSQGPPSLSIQTSVIFPGLQTWKVPHDGYYTIISKGASGGSGIQTQELRTRGAIARGVFYLKKGKELHFLVGQQGLSACPKNMHVPYQSFCDHQWNPPDESEMSLPSSFTDFPKLKNSSITGGGGGGGGATYVFKKQGDEVIPILIGAGGGGLSWSSTTPLTYIQHGRGANDSYPPINGVALYQFKDGAGFGGGLEGKHERTVDGASLQKGGEGGGPCFALLNSYGGFGGGGGGCRAGGGGGGYAGGNSDYGSYRHGEGGLSYVTGMHPQVKPGANNGQGIVFIIPAIRNDCGCQDLCAHLDEHFNESICICTNNRFLASDGLGCIGIPDYGILGMILLLILILVSSGFSIYFYRSKKRNLPGADGAVGTDVQLNQLRGPPGMMVMGYNPNYEFGEGACTIKDLKVVPREHLTLIKALGQGAFGEVYKGYLKTFAGDLVEMPVAVKTLPEMSNSHSEFDFMMEALIMSKFNHPNIVHFIGVCFDKHPRFIVLELLSGGDLKSFLRESRPQPDRPSPLRMKDLLQCALDVAKGCEYLEANHFIHRDIAARNCLLTTKGPGRVVKIADFGMARDIYRNDYYRKGGKAMLPVKWMPPEAFLDGIFISKTDVWSFGVLLWEVMSLGYMPYPGRGNQEVMQLVTNGGRLDPPRNCPAPVYRIMTQCWHPNSEERPTFPTILERLGYCLQDPDVVATALPIFQRPPSSERDATVMRPLDGDACLAVLRRGDDPQSPASTDYLIPMSYSLSTVRSELRSTPSLESGNDCFHMDRLIEDAAPLPPPTWETSFNDEPPNTVAPRPPASVPPVSDANTTSVPTPSSPVIPPLPSSPHLTHISVEEETGASPLLVSPPGSPSPPLPPHHQEARARLLSPDEAPAGSTSSPSSKRVTPRDQGSKPNHHLYHPHLYNNSGSSKTSTSSGNSSTASSSSNSNSSSSTASTLPLDPTSLPCIPPPLQYVNVDVKKKHPPSNFDSEPYTIIETQEHREISC